eukprot:gene7040-7829_t
MDASEGQEGDILETLGLSSASDFVMDNLNKPTNTFVVVVIFCMFIFIIALLFFSCLRTKWKTIYAPRLLLAHEKVLPLGKLPRSFFAWLSPALMVNDEDIFNHLGLDALIYLRFIKLSIKLAVLALPFGIIVLIPLNVNGGMHLKEGLDQISMSNMKQGSKKLWAHFVAVWLYSLAILYLINEEWKTYILYRQAYMTRGAGKQYTLLVRDIPAENTNEDAFREYVEKLFPNQIHSTHIVQDLKQWQLLIKKHNKHVRKLERLQAKQNDQGLDGNYVHGELSDPTRDAVDDEEAKLQRLQEELESEQTSAHKNLPCAFVFFNSTSTKSTASQIVWDMLIGHYKIEDAPDSREIYWKNLALSKKKRSFRQTITNMIVVGLIILWAIPIAFIALLTKIKSVAELKNFNFISSSVKDSSAIGQGFLQGLLPVFLTLLFNLLLPSILRLIGTIRGLFSISKIEKFVFRCLILFLVVNTFFVFITAGAFFSKSQQIIKYPYNITKELAISLPSQSNFYLNYVCLLAFGGTAVELTRLVPMILIYLKLLMAKTPRERLEAWKPTAAPYARLFANDLLILLIGISYSVLSPIIMPAVFIYFLFTYVVWVYQLLHVYIPDHDLGGKLWPDVAICMVVGSLIFQLLMIGVFTLKNHYMISILLVPLLIITLIFWYHSSNKYSRIGRFLSLRESRCARNADRQFIQSLANSYKLNHSCPGVYEINSTPELNEVENDLEYVAIRDAEDGRELRHGNYHTLTDQK